MIKVSTLAISLFLLLSCKRDSSGCPYVRSNIPIPFPYEVVSNISDSLIVYYQTCDTCYLQGPCGLAGAIMGEDTTFTQPGTYQLPGKGMLPGSWISIVGFSKRKGWTLKIVSRTGKVIKSSDELPYEYETPVGKDTFWTKTVWAMTE